MGRFQHVELDRKTLVNIWFLKEIPKQVVANRFWWHRIRWYTSTIIPCKNCWIICVCILWSLGKGYTAVLGFQLDLRIIRVVFFSSHQNGWFLFFVENCDWIYRYSWVSTIYTLLGLEESITTSRMMFPKGKNFRLTLLMPQGQNEWLFQYATSLSSRPAVKLRG